MKKILLCSLLFTFLFKGSVHCQEQHLFAEYIEIVHTGMEDLHVRTMFISKEKLNLEIDKDDREGYEKIFNKPFDSFTKAQKEAIIEMSYNELITDKRTFETMVDFIDRHNEYYTNSKNKNHGDANDFAVIINNGKPYDIFYKLTNTFFNELIKALKENNCDRLIIYNLPPHY